MAKYTPCGGTIHILLTEHKLIVENSGLGVPEECVPRLGERFFRPPGQDVPGSGLGLSMVQQIAALHSCTLQRKNTYEQNTPTGFAASLVFPRT